MQTTLVRRTLPFIRMRPDGLRRAVLAGAAWGLATGLGLVAANAYGCGVLCLDEAAMTVSASIAAGWVTMGPVAALRITV